METIAALEQIRQGPKFNTGRALPFRTATDDLLASVWTLCQAMDSASTAVGRRVASEIGGQGVGSLAGFAFLVDASGEDGIFQEAVNEMNEIIRGGNHADLVISLRLLDAMEVLMETARQPAALRRRIKQAAMSRLAITQT